MDEVIDDVATRLGKRFDGRVPPEVIAAIVRDSADRFAGARVVDFVPLLTERHAVQRLRLLVR
ncbi:MAG: three-helix bundle dimerization domain-containing protein [Acidimicrobiia bacterium]